MTELDDNTLIRFSEYLDGELSEEESAKLEAELDANPELRAAFDEFCSTLRVLEHLGEAPVEEVDLTAGVQRRIRRRSRGRFFDDRRFHQRYQTELFVAIAGAFMVIVLLLMSPERIEILWSDVEPEVEENVESDEPDDEESGPEDPDSSGGSEAPNHDDDPARSAANTRSAGPVAPMPLTPTRGIGMNSPAASARFRTWQYIVESELDTQTLESELRARAGRDNVANMEGGFAVEVRYGSHTSMVERLSELGSVRREPLVVEGRPENIEIVVLSEP